MPLITKKLIVKGEIDKTPPKVKEVKETVPFRKEGTVLIVNGKERKIAKKSQYLLDMLTLED
jgi:hypothetical protein